MEALGQVLRSFPDSLDGQTKLAMLECVFGLGLQSLRAGLREMEGYKELFGSVIEKIAEERLRNSISGLINHLVTLFVRLLSTSAVLHLCQLVGVSDNEEAYEEALAGLGESPATLLINLTLRLNHSESFPMTYLEGLQRRLSKESKMAALNLSVLVQRNTQIFTHRPETLRKIAGILKVNSTELIALAGKPLIPEV